MKTIPLTQGKVALVEDEDFGRLSQYKWSALKNHRNWYAVRHPPRYKAPQKTIGMHRDVLGLHFGDGIKIDHEDGNGLNNQRYNLRICSDQQNARNRKHRLHQHSKFKGVTKSRLSHKPWQAQIKVPGTTSHLGYFRTEEAAAIAYNEAAKLHFKEFAKLNVL